MSDLQVQVQVADQKPESSKKRTQWRPLGGGRPRTGMQNTSGGTALERSGIKNTPQGNTGKASVAKGRKVKADQVNRFVNRFD